MGDSYTGCRGNNELPAFLVLATSGSNGVSYTYEGQLLIRTRFFRKTQRQQEENSKASTHTRKHKCTHTHKRGLGLKSNSSCDSSDINPQSWVSVHMFLLLSLNPWVLGACPCMQKEKRGGNLQLGILQLGIWTTRFHLFQPLTEMVTSGSRFMGRRL